MDAIPLNLQSSDGVFFNATSLTGQYWEILLAVLGVLAPDGLNSLFLPSVISNNLSSIRVAYYGTRSTLFG